MTPLEDPPPYSPNDPYAPPSPERRTSPQPGEEEHRPSLSLRGGYLRPLPAAEQAPTNPTLSPAAYFEERNFESEMVPSLMVLDVDVHPATKRDELPFPLNASDRELRDVNEQDWATFVNYLLTELGSEDLSGETTKGQRWGSMNPEEFFHAKAKMENIVNEWNEAFFMPRGIHFNAKFSFNPPATPTSSQADSETAVEPSERSLPDTEVPEQYHQSIQPGHPHAWGPGPGPMAPPMPMVPPMPMAPPMMNWGRGRGHPFGFGGRGFGRGGDSMPMRGPGPLGPWQHHGHQSWPHHAHMPWEHTSQPGGRHRRSSSVSSSSSSSSESSASSLSASDISDVDVEQVRQAIATFRLDPTRKQHLKQAVHGLHNELRAKRRSSRQDAGHMTREAKAEYRDNRRAIRTELRSLRDEVRNFKRERKLERRAEKRARKAERREAKGKQTAGHEPGSGRERGRWRSRGSSCSSRGRDRYTGQERGVTTADGPLTPPPEALDRQDSFGSGYRLAELSKADRKLENQARHLEMQADHMDRYVRHWDQQIEHYTHVYAQHDVSATHADERREAQFASWIAASSPHKAAKLAEQQTKQREKATKAHERRLAKSASVKDKLLAQRGKAAEMTAELRRQAAALRAKMEAAPPPAPGSAGYARGDAASLSSADTSNSNWRGQYGNMYFERKGKDIENWGERFGRDVEAWGERFGRDWEDWGKRFGKDWEAWGKRMEDKYAK